MTSSLHRYHHRDRVGTTNASRVVSVVVPFFEEGSNLPTLIGRLKRVLDALPATSEVLFVDDGSADGSAAVAIAAIDGDLRFRVLRLRGNFGKSAAIAAGRDHSAGDVIVTMDADLQDPPEHLPRFLEEIERGNDVVAGWRRDRRAPWHRRVYTALFNRCVRMCTGIAIHDMNCGMKAYRRSALETIYLSRGMHRFTAILAQGNGFRVSELEVPNHERLSGRTKFGAGRYFEAAVGLLGALYVRRPARTPLMSFGAVGGVLLLLSLIGAGVHALWGPSETDARLGVLVALSTLCLLGAILLVGGLVGELIMQRLAGGLHTGPVYLLHESREQAE